MNHGTIIILNGTSSSGKTSVLHTLQDTLEEPYLEAGIDKFIFMLPERYLERPLWDDVLGLAVQAGEAGHRLFSGMHHAIAALAKNGNNIIVDHVLVEEVWIKELVDLLSEQIVWVVGVHCPLEVLVEREQARRNRTPGQAAAQFPLVHANMLYDVEVDTSILTPEECAKHIKETMMLNKHPAAFDQLEERFKL